MKRSRTIPIERSDSPLRVIVNDEADWPVMLECDPNDIEMDFEAALKLARFLEQAVRECRPDLLSED